MEYQTKAGDTWDSIAYEQLGSEKYMGLLMEANPELIAYVVFDSGVSIQIPEVPKEDVADSASSRSSRALCPATSTRRPSPTWPPARSSTPTS